MGRAEICHVENKHTAAFNIIVTDEGIGQAAPVKGCTTKADMGRGGMVCAYFKGVPRIIAAVELHRYFPEIRTSQPEVAAKRIDRIKAHGAEYVPCGQRTTVIIAGQSARARPVVFRHPFSRRPACAPFLSGKKTK